MRLYSSKGRDGNKERGGGLGSGLGDFEKKKGVGSVITSKGKARGKRCRIFIWAIARWDFNFQSIKEEKPTVEKKGKRHRACHCPRGVLKEPKKDKGASVSGRKYLSLLLGKDKSLSLYLSKKKMDFGEEGQSLASDKPNRKKGGTPTDGSSDKDLSGGEKRQTPRRKWGGTIQPFATSRVSQELENFSLAKRASEIARKKKARQQANYDQRNREFVITFREKESAAERGGTVGPTLGTGESRCGLGPNLGVRNWRLCFILNFILKWGVLAFWSRKKSTLPCRTPAWPRPMETRKKEGGVFLPGERGMDLISK